MVAMITWFESSNCNQTRFVLFFPPLKIEISITFSSGLTYAIVEPITAVDRDGKPVDESAGAFKEFFSINSTTGDVYVAQPLDRNIAATVTMKVQVKIITNL